MFLKSKNTRTVLGSLTLMLFCFLILISCSNTEKSLGTKDIDMESAVKIPVNFSKEPVKLSHILQETGYIRLETSKNCLIGHIDKLIFADHKIFVLDKYISQGVFVFDSDGVFLYRIGNMGKGSEDYLEALDLAIDRKKKQLMLLDLKGRKVNFYDYSGKFNSSVKLPWFFQSFALINEDKLAFSTSTAYNSMRKEVNNHYLVLGSLGGNVASKAFPYQEEARRFSYNSEFPLHVFDDTVYFNPRFSNNIYKISNDGIRGAFQLVFDDGGIPPSQLESISDEDFTTLRSTKSCFDGNFILLANGSNFTVSTPTGVYDGFYNNKSQKTIFSKSYVFEDEHALLQLFKSPKADYDNQFVCVVTANELLAMPKMFKSTDLEFEKLYSGLTSESNPVLFLYKLNDF